MKWDIRDIEKWPWHQHLYGLLNIEGGNTEYFNTGTWRSRRPVLDKEKCNSCLRCFIYCPEGSISVQDGKMDGFDYYHCKGCGICARECNIGAISMSEEVTGGVRPNK